MLAKDKIQHIALGVVWLAVCAIGTWVLRDFGLGAALAYGTTTYAAMYEFNQWYRKDGQPEVLDAICTAAPGFVAWVGLELFKGVV